MKKPTTLGDSDDFDPNGDINAANNFAEQGWRYRSGPAATRAALPSDEKFVGLAWRDTDNGGFLRVWDGTQWKLRGSWGAYRNQSTDSAFGLITVNHPLGVTPDWVTVSPAESGNDALSLVLGAVVWTRDASGVQIRFRREDTNQWLPSTVVRFFVSMGCV